MHGGPPNATHRLCSSAPSLGGQIIKTLIFHAEGDWAVWVSVLGLVAIVGVLIWVVRAERPKWMPGCASPLRISSDFNHAFIGPLVRDRVLDYVPRVPGSAKVMPYAVARLGAAFLTGVGFFLIALVFVAAVINGMHVDRLTLDQARWMYAIVLSSVPAFAAQGAAISFPDAYLQNKFALPPSAASEPAAASASNPWGHALLLAGLVGVPVAVLSFWWITRTWPADGVAASEFVLWLSGWSGLIAAVVLYARTGRVFLREVGVSAEGRRFRGSVQQYAWQRHALPQFLINAWFNAWVAPTMVQGPYADPSSYMPRTDLWLEAGMTGVLVTLGIAAGTRGYAMFDLRWGVVPRIAARAPHGLRFTGQLFAMAVGTWLLLGLVLFGLGIERVGTWPLVIWRALWFGALPGVAAYQTAIWTLSTADPAPAAASRGPGTTTETASG